jgi:hypothetical protein
MAVSDEAAVHTRTITWHDPLPGTGAAARIFRPEKEQG